MIKEPVEINFSRNFDKQLKKASLKIKIAFRERLKLFLKDQFCPLLNNHVLTGKFSGYRSINVTGDWRAIFTLVKKKESIGTVVNFELLGTHGQLYG